MIRPEEEADLDLDWFALDSQGHVGHFTTGGCGALPRSAAAGEDLEKVRDYFRALPEIGASVLNRDRLSGIRLHPFDKAEPRESVRYWADSAARGLFAYDYLEDRRRRPRPYWVVARPEVPLVADELPPDVRAVVGRTVLRDVAFAHDDVIPMACLL